MSSADGDRSEPGDPASASPRGVSRLTEAGEEARRDVLDAVSDALETELRLRRRTRKELTSDDVYAAWAIVEQSLRPPPSPRSPSPLPRTNSLPSLGSGMIAIGSVGVASMHPYLHSPWQIGLLGLFVLSGMTGVVLSWRVGRDAGSSAMAGEAT